FATALAGRDDTAMRPAIRKLRGYVGDRFFYADADLNRQCEQLRRLGDALSGLLGDAAPVFTHEGVN
ncbi:MAG: hypothetical protein JOZ48_01530, partial [Acidobacteriaceae bacterium]|nr:hypothetical protein [Acidobacteriaceae bacterium]